MSGGWCRTTKDVPNPLGDKRRVHGNPWELPVVPAGTVLRVLTRQGTTDTTVVAYDARRGRLWLTNGLDTAAEAKKRAALVAAVQDALEPITDAWELFALDESVEGYELEAFVRWMAKRTPEVTVALYKQFRTECREGVPS